LNMPSPLTRLTEMPLGVVIKNHVAIATHHRKTGGCVETAAKTWGLSSLMKCHSGTE